LGVFVKISGLVSAEFLRLRLRLASLSYRYRGVLKICSRTCGDLGF
jgi:hypothetical protein